VQVPVRRLTPRWRACEACLGARKKCRADGALEDGGDDGWVQVSLSPSIDGDTPTSCRQDHTVHDTLIYRSPSCKPLTTETPLHLPQQAVHEREGLASIIPDP
jgi:hypothetical protein